MICLAFTSAFLSGCGKTEVKEYVPVYITATPTPKPTNTNAPTNTPTNTPTPTVTPTPRPELSVSGLAEFYQDLFPIGVAASASTLRASRYKDLLTSNFVQITPENETKPDAILQETASRNGLPETYTRAKVDFSRCDAAVKFCIENNMQMRLHTLVWHSQTPAWFFTEDYTKNGKLVSREVMLQRMENYIKDVLDYFDTNYPGLIYAVDVCNEAFDSGDGDADGIRMKNNKWYDTVGPDYYYQAFVFARKYAPDYMKLFYNDYGCSGKYNRMIKHLAKAKEEGLIDGIGMQSHLSLSDRITTAYLLAMKAFLNEGYEVQVTELDIGMDANTESNMATQARKYKVLFSTLKELKEQGCNISSVTLWGLTDSLSWRSGKYPLLFDSSLNPKKAYYAALLDPSIPTIE